MGKVWLRPSRQRGTSSPSRRPGVSPIRLGQGGNRRWPRDGSMPGLPPWRCLIALREVVGMAMPGPNDAAPMISSGAPPPIPETCPSGEDISSLRRVENVTSTCVESTTTIPSRTYAYADHLHVRGEHAMRSRAARIRNGPPPRAWRARAALPAAEPARRTTSTCVESTGSSGAALRHGPDHLHVRGEHPEQLGGDVGGGGSPPRAWRARVTDPVLIDPGRITSTCVESTRSPQRADPKRTDHLHVRGEHGAVAGRSCGGGGSPPRAWRAPTIARASSTGTRITSTCVESTRS